MKRAVLLCLCLMGLSLPAHADRSAYCQAYARDFADQIATEKTAWDHKFKIAIESCMSAKASAPVVKAKATPAESPAAKPKTAAAETPAPPEPQADAVPPAQDSATADPAQKLTPGSQAWNDYCAKKYASFDPKTGTYKSLKGITRPCLVTKGAKG